MIIYWQRHVFAYAGGQHFWFKRGYLLNYYIASPSGEYVPIHFLMGHGHVGGTP